MANKKPRSIIDIDIDDLEIEFEELDTVIQEDPIKNVHAEPQVIAPPQTKARQLTKDLHNLTHCPRCNKPLVKAITIADTESISFLECPECGTLINTFKPTTYQAKFLKRLERYKMTAGGFGTGKSRINIEDVIKHLLLIKYARVVVCARTYPVLDATFVKEFYSIFPKKLVKKKNESKHEITLTNGSELLFRSFDDPNKLKSINASMVVIVEASDILYAGFTMMQSRLRKTAACIPELDANGDPVKVYDKRSGEMRIKYRIDVRHINLETNPDSGWVKKFLLDSKFVEFFGEAKNEGYKFNKNPDPNKYTQVASTSANPYLPENYEEEQTRDKPKAYVQQFYKGSFNFSSGLVLPNFGVCIVPPHGLPEKFDTYGRRILHYVIGLDYGVNDPTHVVFGAFSTVTKKLYIFAEMRINNSDVKTIAKEYRKEYKQNGTDINGLMMQPMFDGRSYNRRQADLKTIGEMFEAEGLYFEPSFASMEARIIKTNALINHEQLEVFSTCEFLIEEALNWKWKKDKRTGEFTNKPVDKNDHGIQAMNFITVALPNNLKELNLAAYVKVGEVIKHDIKYVKKKKKDPVFDPLKEDNNGRNSNGITSNIIVSHNPNYNRSFGISNSLYEDDSEGTEEQDYYKPLGAYVPGQGRR